MGIQAHEIMSRASDQGAKARARSRDVACHRMRARLMILARLPISQSSCVSVPGGPGPTKMGFLKERDSESELEQADGMNWMEQVYAREPNVGADQEGLSMQGDDRRTPRAEAGRAVSLNPTSSAILS